MPAATPGAVRTRSRSLRGWLRPTVALCATALMVVGAAPASAAPTGLSAPVLDLRFEGGVTDSSALAHPVTVKGHNGSTTVNTQYVPGVKTGTQALQLGGNTYLDLGPSTELQPQNLTLSFWIKPTGAISGEQLITWNKRAYNTDGWYLSSESNTSPLALSIGPASGQPYKVRVASADRASFLPADTWTHIAVSYDRTTKDVKFYRNGETVAATVSNGVGGDATGLLGSDPALPKTIGFNGPQYNGAYLRAGLDEYKVFNGVASHAEVAALYEESGKVIDRAAIAQSDAAGLTLPGTATIGLILSATGSRGSTVTWTSSAPDVIAADGTVVQPDEGQADVVVTLTAAVSYLGGAPVTRSFEVTVPAERSSDVLADSGLDTYLLSDDYLNNAAAKEHEYLLELSADTFLFEFYKVAGLTPPTAAGYGGWERSNAVNFRGHAFGHYMSALAMSYASTTDPAVKQGLLDEIVDAVGGLDQVQTAYAAANPASAGYVSAFRESILDAVQGTGTSNENVIVPWYNLHKVLAGLLDISEYVEGPTGDLAFEIAEEFGEYIYNRVSKIADKTTLLRTEYGGMNEALYELFDRSGGNVHFKVAAEAFDETTLFRSLAAGQDVLPGKHANTTIPKLIGALKRYTVFTQNEQYYNLLTEQEKRDLPMYLTAAENFFTIVVAHHTFVTGAHSQAEHFHGPDELHDMATGNGARGNAETSETCNEYNMLKLSRELFKLTKDVKYADYYENTFINVILASQNPETGMTTYFQPMASGYEKIYSMPFTEFWCCTGTGMENFSKLGDSIYFTGGSSVYVNLFFSSAFRWAERNLTVTQEANLPTDDEVTFTVGSVDGGAVDPGTTLRVRVPNWIAGDPVVTRNGAPVTPVVSGGYLQLTDLAAGDVFTYRMPMQVSVVDTPDNENFVAFRYGPVVLSAGLGTSNPQGTLPTGILVRVSALDTTAQDTITARGVTAAQWKQDITENLVRIADSADGEVQFQLRNTADGGDLVFTPHFSRHSERYALYLNLDEPDSQASQDRIKRDKEAQREVELSVDSLNSFDGNNFEAEKNLQKSANSTIGIWQGRQYRDAAGGGWFSYDLAIDPTAAKNHLRATYFSGDNGRSFDVYVNDEKLKTVRVTNAAGSNVFYPETDEIPAKHLTGTGVRYKTDALGQPVLDPAGNRIPVVTVRFQSTGGLVGGLYGVSVLRTTVFDTDAQLSKLGSDVGTLAPAFAPAQKSYTLTVPVGTTAVNLDADPHLPSGLVKVDGVLIDDTQLRAVTLPADGADKVVTVQSFAQDHTTSTTYTVTIRAQSVPKAEIATSTACLSGKAVLTVRVRSTSQTIQTITATTGLGTKTWVGVAPKGLAIHNFAATGKTYPAGTLTFTSSDGSTTTLQYPGRTCA